MSREAGPEFTWEEHGARIDAMLRALVVLERTAPMELPAPAWNRIAELIEREIAAARQAPDPARDAWEAARLAAQASRASG